MMLKLIRRFFIPRQCSTVRHRSHFLIEHDSSSSFFLCFSHTARLLVSCPVCITGMNGTREHYCHSPEYNGNSSTHRRKWVHLCIHCFALSFSLFVEVFLCSSSLQRSRHSLPPLFHIVELFLETNHRL